MKLFHISFKENLTGLWIPKTPDGYTGTGKYPEPDTPRISVSPSIEKCFRAIYPNVSKFFESDDFPYMDFWVYAPVNKPQKIIYPNELTKKHWVWDAHKTDEHWLLIDTEMKRLGQVRVFNTNKERTLMVHPFDDSKLSEVSYGPENIKIKIISGDIKTSDLK